MTGDADLARVAELMADRTRSRILLALIAGRELSASLLAAEAGVSRPTASAHLRKLSDGGLIAVRVDGKRRHYRLTGPEVADVIERLTALAPPEPITSLRASTRAAQLRRARSCYELTGSGRDFLDDLGVELPRSRRPLIRYCIDWTETRHHLAGRRGRGLRDRFLELGWVEERTASRALRISPDGVRGFAREFGFAA